MEQRDSVHVHDGGLELRRKREPRGNLDTQKCHRCRQQKVKCLPAGRVWPDKCNRCKKQGLSCSENTKAKRRRSEKLNTTVEPDKRTEVTLSFVDPGLQPSQKPWTDAELTTSVSLLRVLRRTAERERQEMSDLATLFTLYSAVSPPGFTPIAHWNATQLRHLINKLQEAIHNETSWQLIEGSEQLTEPRRRFLGQIMSATHLPVQAACELQDEEEYESCQCGKFLSRSAIGSLHETGDYGAAMLLLEDYHAHEPGTGHTYFLLEWLALQQHFNSSVSQLPFCITDAEWSKFFQNRFLFDTPGVAWRVIADCHLMDKPFPNTSDFLGKSWYHFISDYSIHTKHDRASMTKRLFQANPVDAEAPGDQLGQNMLHMVCKAGLDEVVEMCIAADFDVNKGTKYGSTPLHYAAAQGFNHICEILLIAGGDPDETDCIGATPLHYAISNGHTTTAAQLIVEAGAIDAVATHQGLTPLALAITQKRVSTFELMIREYEYTRSEAAYTQNGGSLLQLAVLSGVVSMVEVLLEVMDMEDINHQNHSGETALLIAARCGQEDIFRLILEQPYVKADLVDHLGRCPLHLSAAGGHMPICKMLAQRYDGGLLTQDSEGKTPKSVAVESGNDDIASYLDLVTDSSITISTMRAHQNLSRRRQKGDLIWRR